MNCTTVARAIISLLTVTLTACGAAPQNAIEAGSSSAPMLFSSSHAPAAIAKCLRDRITTRVDEHPGAGYLELGVGHSSNGYAWLITLTPSAPGSNVRVEQAVDDGSVSEPELRYAIARCTT